MTRLMISPRSTVARHRRALQPRPEGLEGRQLLTAGALDTAFGTGGYLITSLPDAGFSKTSNAFATGVQIQPSDGKILLAGRSTAGDFGLVRLSPAGAPDTTFGIGRPGSVTTDFNGKVDVARDMALLPDGRILLAGLADMGVGRTTNDDFALACYLPSGTLDTSFGLDHTGKVTTNISTSTTGNNLNQSDAARAIAVQADGKIVLAGMSYSPNGYLASLARYNADGTPDKTFGSLGKIINPAGHILYDVAIQSIDGFDKIVVTGDGVEAGGQYGVFVARYNADGTPDMTFGQDGSVLTTIGATGNAEGHGLVLRTDGTIVVAGNHSNTSDSDLVLVRYTSVGSLDPSFQGGVVEVVRSGGSETANAITAQLDGKLVVVGGSTPRGSSNPNSLVARFLLDGTLDSDFKDGGVTTISASSYWDKFESLAVQSNGYIVAVGAATPPGVKPPSMSNPVAFYIARFQGDTASLRATAMATTPVGPSLTPAQARPALAQALALWRARGADTPSLGRIGVVIADPGGDRLGETSGSTIALDGNAAGWSWSIGRGRGRRLWAVARG